jgi:hypothetical protein
MKQVFSYSYGAESYGIVYQNESGLYEVYEIPSYSGDEKYYKTYASIDDAIQAAKSFLTF